MRKRKYQEEYEYYLKLIDGRTEPGNELTYRDFVYDLGIVSEVLKHHGIEYRFGDMSHIIIDKEKADRTPWKIRK